MATNTQTPSSSKTTRTRQAPKRPRPAAQAPGGLPPDFDAQAFTREACERSGVTFAVTDPVTLAKLRVLTRPEN